MLVQHLLDGKAQSHRSLIDFLHRSGVYKTLSNSSRATLLEHGEKLVAAVSLRETAYNVRFSL